MKKNFGFDTKFNKIKLSARSLWMGFERGEGELEIENQGRFDQSRFTQETEAIGQQTPRIGESRSTLRFTQRVSSAGSTLNSDSTPQFLSAPLVQDFARSSMPVMAQSSVEDSSRDPSRASSEDASRENRFSLEERAVHQFSLTEKIYDGPFPLQGKNHVIQGAISGIHFTVSSSEIQLAKTVNEQATLAVADKTQKRLASLFKAAARDEDSAV
jgi:hypothetical protein